MAAYTFDVSADMWDGGNTYQEDRLLFPMRREVNGKTLEGIGVVDGHGGHEAADFLASNLLRAIFDSAAARIRSIATKNHDEEDVLASVRHVVPQVFEEAQAEWKHPSGAAVALLILDCTSGNVLSIHLGDCRVQVHDRTATFDDFVRNPPRWSTTDHDIKEEDIGGGHSKKGVHFEKGPLKGSLVHDATGDVCSIGGAFGDCGKFFVPHIRRTPEMTLLPFAPDCQFVLASDGLWDVLSQVHQQEGKYIDSYLARYKGNDTVIDPALLTLWIERICGGKSWDNTSVVVARLVHD
jgi:serine/threonine protein phosphatase PrpC